jgi:hypothetical protein
MMQDDNSQISPTPTQNQQTSENTQTQPTPTQNSTPTPTSEYSTVTFTWYLKPEYINNVTWLNQTWGGKGNNTSQSRTNYYDESVSWNENYLNFLASLPYYVVRLQPLLEDYVSASVNMETGYTVLVNKYIDRIYLDVDYSHNYTILNLRENTQKYLNIEDSADYVWREGHVVICDDRGYTVTFN